MGQNLKGIDVVAVMDGSKLCAERHNRMSFQNDASAQRSFIIELRSDFNNDSIAKSSENQRRELITMHRRKPSVATLTNGQPSPA